MSIQYILRISFINFSGFEGCEQNLTPEKGLEVGTGNAADSFKPKNEDTIEQSSSRTSERSAPMFILLLNALIISDVDQEIDRKAIALSASLPILLQ